MVADLKHNDDMGDCFEKQWWRVHDLTHNDDGWMILNTMMMGERFENTMMLSAWFETQLWWKNDLKHTDDGWMIWHTMMMGEWF